MRNTKPHVISRTRDGARDYDWTKDAAREVEPSRQCDVCWSDVHETHECPLNADRFVDPGDC